MNVIILPGKSNGHESPGHENDTFPFGKGGSRGIFQQDTRPPRDLLAPLAPLFKGGTACLQQQFCDHLIEILSIAIRAVRGIGGANGNAVAAALAKGLVHDRIPAVYGIGPKAYGLVGTDGNTPAATPAKGIIHDTV